MPASWKLLHEDASFLLVDKPSGLLTVPGRGVDKQHSLLSELQAAFPEVLLVHRLDRDTSGIMVVARNPESQRELSRQFEAREVTKTYLAWVQGVLDRTEGFIDLPMRKDMDSRLPPRYLVDHEQGKPAQTHWKKLKEKSDTSLLGLSPLTGRSHQLRVHLLSIGHPILGDPIYNPESTASRLMLHAQGLRLFHPVSGAELLFTSPSSIE